MSYATQDDIDLRYPGAIEQAGPRDTAGNLDEEAIALALTYASEQVAAAAEQAGLTLSDPAPDWVIGLVVDIALYRATPSAIASDAAFADRRKRYEDALARTRRIARGEELPPPDTGAVATVPTFYLDSQPRRGWAEL